MTPKIVWLDDLAEDEASLGMRRELSKVSDAFDLIVTTNEDEFYKTLDQPDVRLAVIDYHLEETDGITVAQRMLAMAPTVRILFMSEYLDQFFPGNKLDPRAIYDVIEKPGREIREWRDGTLMPAVEQLLARQPASTGLLRSEECPPVALTDPDGFDFLPFDAQMQAAEEYARWVRPFTDVIFAESDAEWLLVAGAPPVVARWGSVDANRPSEATRRDIEDTVGAPTFVISRPIQVEEVVAVELEGGATWSVCEGVGPTKPSRGDVYPTLAIELWQWRAEIHLDTGSPYSFLSFEDLQDARLVEKLPKGRFAWDIEVLRLGPEKTEEQIRSTILDQIVQVDSLDGTVDLRLVAKVIRPWRSTGLSRVCTVGNCAGSISVGVKGFLCGHRKGLLGRDILRRNSIQLVLDSSRNRSYVMIPQPGAAPPRLPEAPTLPDAWDRFRVD